MGAGASPVAIDPQVLLDRDPRPIDEDVVGAAIAGKTVLITGAGGSIGSELARRVASLGPARLVLVERAENPLFDVDGQIAAAFPDLAREAVLHDVTRRRPTRDLLARLSPDFVLHAAAHKHVPMMEDHPAEAVENNLYGTRSIADAAQDAGAERFVMISTDKAVRPSSVMGASKRLAELYVQGLAAQSDTRFAMVRFGNVLGSACSVLPIWSGQVARGGPLTITDPGMTRYFMTIPEAAGLVLQAGVGATGGEVFLLDMGRPVRIVDLAERFLAVQGFEPGVDVELKFTGARPGEKLHEELAYADEESASTPHPSIRVWRGAPPSPASITQIMARFDRLRDKARLAAQADGEGPADPPGAWEGVAPDAVLRAIDASLPSRSPGLAKAAG